MLPDDWRDRAGEPGTAACARVVCDYIAGMTDRFALEEHRRLTDPKFRGDAEGCGSPWRCRAARDTPPTMTSTDIFATLRARTLAASRPAADLPAEAFARVQMEPPRDPAHGDMATNAALVVGKAARQPPAKLAQALAEKLAALPEVENAAPAGPGFVNLRLRGGILRAQLPAILTAGEGFGDGATGGGRKVNVEYVSANPTGPMHVGHCRGAVVGDALANLLGKAGWDVTKEYYINDAGAQVQALALAAYWRYLQVLVTTPEGQSLAAGNPALAGFAGSARSREDFEQAFGITLQYGGDIWCRWGRRCSQPMALGWCPPRAPRHPRRWSSSAASPSMP